MADPLSRNRKYHRIVAYVTPEVEKQFKMIAIERDCFVNDLAVEAVTEWLDRYTTKKNSGNNSPSESITDNQAKERLKKLLAELENKS